MESVAASNDSNDSLGILNLEDPRFSFINEMEDLECTDCSNFEKTLQRLQKTGIQQLRTLSSSLASIGLESNFNPMQDNELDKTSNSVLDSALFKPSSEITLDETSSSLKKKDVEPDLQNDSVFSVEQKLSGQEITCSTPKKPFQNEMVPIRSYSQNTIEEEKERYFCDSNGMKRAYSLDHWHLSNLDQQKDCAGRDSEFLTGEDALNRLHEDEKEFNEKHRYEISHLSAISTSPEFSHVSDSKNDSYFRGRSEKLGSIGEQRVDERPSCGLLIKSPSRNGSQLTDESRKTEDSSAMGKTLENSSQLSESASSSRTPFTVPLNSATNTNSAGHQPVQPTTSWPPTCSSNHHPQQALNVRIPVQEVVSCCHSGPPNIRYAPYNWGEQAATNFNPQIHQPSMYRGLFTNAPTSLINFNEYAKMIVPAELPEQVVCTHDAIEIKLTLSNPLYHNTKCLIKVLNVAILDSVAVKMDVTGNCNFTLPDTVEIKAGASQTAQIACCFKLPGKYRVYFEIVSESSQAPTTTAITITCEEAKVEMFSAADGGSCIDFGQVCDNRKVCPQFIRVANKGQSVVPIKIHINSISHTSDNFIFPPEILSTIVKSSPHNWLDVLPTYIVMRLNADSALDLPVTVDIGHPFPTCQEQTIASVQLLLKGNSFFRTKSLMKLRACLNTSTNVKQTVKPESLFPVRRQLCSRNVDDKCHLPSKGSLLASNMRTLYFPGVEVGNSLMKVITLMNRSQTTRLLVHLSILSGGGQYFIKDGEKERSRLQIVVFEPKQKKEIFIVFKPLATTSSASSLRAKVSAPNVADKQEFLVPICGYGGSSHVTMLQPVPNSLTRAHMWISPVNKTANELKITLNNSGSRAAFVAILPIKDGQIELDRNLKLGAKAFVILPGETNEVKIKVEVMSYEDICKLRQNLIFYYGDEQLRQFLKNKISFRDASDRTIFDGPGLLKAVNILQSFHGENAVSQEELYKEFKNDIAEVFYQSIKTYDLVLSTEVASTDEPAESFFVISNMSCTYGSLLNSTVLPPDRSLVPSGTSPPIRD